MSRLAHPLAAGMTFRVEDEERDGARNVPRLVNGFDTKKKDKINLLMNQRANE